MILPIHFQSSGTGIPFFFQHGLGSNLNQPQGLLATLPGVHLFSMDCPGHGTASLDPGVLPSFELYANQLYGLIQTLGFKQVIIGGISMGAGIALQIALKYPECVRALVLVRPAWLDQRSPANLSILTQAARLTGLSDGMDEFKKLKEFNRVHEVLPMAGASILGVFGNHQQSEIGFVLESLVEDRPFDRMGQLKHIEAPSLILGNDNDPLHPFEMAQRINDFIPNSKLVKTVSRYIDNLGYQQQIQHQVSKFISKI